jgi:precorrin-6B methylase 2
MFTLNTAKKAAENRMPFVLPNSLLESDRLALVLAFGRLSILEACSVLGRSVTRAESPNERVAVLSVQPPASTRVPELAGAHKVAPLTLATDGEQAELGKLVNLVAQNLDEKSNLSMSGYGLEEDDYEDLVRSLLDGVRASGLRKVRLLRPEGNELLAEQVRSRKALDVIAFPYHEGFGLGPTTWVPDAASMRQRGTGKPAPRSDISMSPRLAQVLLNLAGLRQGQTVLDPFCGTGTILVEAYIRGLRCLGIDSSASRVQDARQNLQWSGGGREGYDIRKGDARELHRLLRGTKVGAIVTEPVLLPRLDARPRTATASELVETAGEVYSDAFASMASSIQPGGRIVIVVPVVQTIEGEEVALRLEGRKLGLKLYQPGPTGFEYPVRLSFESTRWVRRGVYVFESES